MSAERAPAVRGLAIALAVPALLVALVASWHPRAALAQEAPPVAAAAATARAQSDAEAGRDRKEPEGGWLDFRKGLVSDLAEAAGESLTVALAALLQSVAETARRAVDGVLSSSINFVTQTPPAVSYDSPTVRGLWVVVRGIANAALAAVAVWGGFNLMAREHLGTPYHAALELLPRIAIAALLANTSLWWGKLAIDANNALCLSFGQASLPSWESAGAGVQALVNVALSLIYLITALLLLLQMLMRLALVDLLLVLAPLALVCWVLPQTQGWCRLWTSTFSGTVFTQLVQVATLKLGGLLLAELAPLTRDQSLVSFCVAIALMALTLKVPGHLRGRLGDGLGFARYYAYRLVAGAVAGGAGGSGGRQKGA